MINPKVGTAIIAAFDFDHTLLRGDTLLILHRLVHRPSAFYAGCLTLVPQFVRWKLGCLSTTAFKECYLGAILHSTSLVQRRMVFQHQLPDSLMRLLNPEAVQRLRWHQRQGHRVVIVTALPRFLISPVAERLGVELLATETTDPMIHTPSDPLRLTSANCKGAEKTRRLQEWFQEPLSSVILHAYGDSHGDRELLQASNHPHWRSFVKEAPYPGKELRQSRPLPWTVLLGLGLLLLAVFGITSLPQGTLADLGSAAQSLLVWSPALFGVLTISYLCRYWRWRVLLASQCIGQTCLVDAWAWFQGFALTATPAKLGELSRVQQLHNQLGYPRPALVQVFVAERLADVGAVTALLLILAPAQLADRLSGYSMVPLQVLLAMGALVAFIGFLFRQALARAMRHLRHHFPSGALARAMLQATAISVLVWGIEAILLWLLVRALSPVPISLPIAITTYLISGTVGMASSMPGGIGVNEATTVVLLSQQGIPAAVGLPIAILRRLITPWSVVALATAAGLNWSGDRRAVRS